MRIDHEVMSSVFEKYHVRETPWRFDLPIHHFTGPDPGDPHDHPWDFKSHIIEGGYVEEIYLIQPDGKWIMNTYTRLPGTSHFTSAGEIHRIIKLLDGECLTVVRPTPPYRKTCFWQFRDDGIFYRQWDWLVWTRFVI